MFSPEDSHANHTQWQESDLAKRMTATSGQKCLESLEKLSPDGSLARMFSGLLIGMEGWYSTKCKLTWKLKGTKYGRMYCQLYPSTLPTEETEYGLLPTPKAMDGMAENVNSGKELKLINGSFVNIRPKDGMRFGPSLNDIAKANLLLTPTAMDSTNATATMKSSQVKEGSMHSVTLTRAMAMGMLPTPRACESIERRNMKTIVDKVENGGDVTLTTLAKYKGGILLPTPTAQIVKHGHSEKYWNNRIGKRQMDIAMWNAETNGKTSQLSPQFVMEMMGFPTDWTLLPFLNGETNQSKLEETQ
jgi:hypothetical protein